MTADGEVWETVVVFYLCVTYFYFQFRICLPLCVADRT